MMTSMQDIVKKAQSFSTKTMVVAVANDHHVLEAVHMAKTANIIHPILIGDEAKILQVFSDLNLMTDGYQIINCEDAVQTCREAVKLVSSHVGYFLMKGHVDSSIILKAALDKEIGLRTQNRLSHVSVMEIPTYHKLLIMSDGAMNIDPNVDIKQEIIENGVIIAHAIGIQNPKIGCLAAVEKVNPKMQATLDAQELIRRNKAGIIQGCTIGGPFAMDNAINKDAALHKGVKDPMAGDVDFILMPQIESGNIFYKSMIFMANAKGASIIAGAKRPIVLTSRADSKNDKFYSIALGALVTEHSQS
ncbi:MAG: bifunctional enoyl-CoA hydratase/phosphate acetyltransferase [Acholeplasmataceae bacterium]|nr:bifunctional enoyl-CoA hydratase/phosphate acetyltransferase [Acholeplasmataceae bacterium]